MDCPIMTANSRHYSTYLYLTAIYITFIREDVIIILQLTQLQLSYEQWDDVFGNNNVNEIFNNFLNTYLRCYYSNFTKKVIKSQHNYKHWITTAIKTSCKRKRELLFLCRLSNDPNLKIHYKIYCKLLCKVILTEKKNYVKTESFSTPRIKW